MILRPLPVSDHTEFLDDESILWDRSAEVKFRRLEYGGAAGCAVEVTPEPNNRDVANAGATRQTGRQHVSRTAHQLVLGYLV